MCVESSKGSSEEDNKNTVKYRKLSLRNESGLKDRSEPWIWGSKTLWNQFLQHLMLPPSVSCTRAVGTAGYPPVLVEDTKQGAWKANTHQGKFKTSQGRLDSELDTGREQAQECHSKTKALGKKNSFNKWGTTAINTSLCRARPEFFTLLRTGSSDF